MSCEWRDSVAAHLLGGLPDDEAVEVDRHVLDCEECTRVRQELALVPALLATVRDDRGHDPVEVPTDLGDAVVARVLGAERRGPQGSRRDRLRPFLAGVAATLLLGVLPLGVWAHAQRSDNGTTLALAGTSAAPDAWAEARVHPRAGGGTLVDLEAGDLPSRGATYVVSITRGGTVLASRRFRADTDGWGRVVLATPARLAGGATIDVVREDRAGTTPVLHCDCDT